MIILTWVPEYLIEDFADNKEQIAWELYQMIEQEYADKIPEDDGPYLDSVHGDALESTGMILGADDPDAIIEKAKSWNRQADDLFQFALDKIIGDKAPSYEDGVKIWRDCKIYSRYGMYKAAAAIDDEFHPFADFLSYVGDNPRLKPLIDSEDLPKIIGSPKEYAIISVYPK